MEKNILFPQVGGLIHGGDYNPEQWLDRPDILEEDIRLMKKAGMNSATLGMFSWSVYEPSEGEFNFEWLSQIVNSLYENGIYTILGTPGARPAWLDEAYPEAMRVNRDGVRNRHGMRHNHCMSSPKYREKVSLINHQLAQRFGSHPGLIMWHISNEFGGECFCPACCKRFQEYLAKKFEGNIEALNKAWWATFWSHRYNSFEQIEPPFANGENSVMGLNLEWRRFTSWNMTDYMKSEIEVFRKLTPGIPITTNFMKLFSGIDYHEMAKELDVISWDSYPAYHNPDRTLYETFAETAFDHSVMRSMKKDTPFMLMESTPSLVNWHTVNKLKRPGIHKQSCLQAIGCGSDTVQYFQWRKGRGSFEQYHGAVVDHLGTDDTRVFKDVEEVGRLLEILSPVAGTTVMPRAALLFDWDNRWAISDMKGLSNQSKCYEKVCMDIYAEFLKLGVEMDIISSRESFEDYSAVIAPMLYLLDKGVSEKLKAYVEKGGQLAATYLTGYVDENLLCYLGGFPGDGLADLFGIISEEIDSLYPDDRNSVKFTNGTVAEVRDYAEIIRAGDAEVLACYQEDFYAETPAVTKKSYGKGNAYYIGARIASKDLGFLWREICRAGDIAVKDLPPGIEYHERAGENTVYEFYLNHNIGTETVTIEGVTGDDLLSKKPVNGSLELNSMETAIIRRREK